MALSLSVVATGPKVLFAQCSLEAVPISVRSELLNTFAPIWWSPEQGSSGPQSVQWMCRHGFFKIFLRSNGSQVGATPTIAAPYTPDQLLDYFNLAQTPFPTADFEYRWAYYDADQGRNNADPSDPMGWAFCSANGVGVYGRVMRCATWPADQYIVQYYQHWGWNETDTPPGCDAGNHEGDWIGVEYTVDRFTQRILSAIYHNHGRQIFIDDPNSLVLTGTHPHVFVERGTNEPWPFAGADGFRPNAVPPGISTNKRFEQNIAGTDCELEYESSCNFGYTVVREHEANGGSFTITPTDIGERGAPRDLAEARFILGYPGLYGSFWDNGDCYFGLIVVDTSSPPGPPFAENGDQMWDRNFHNGTTRIWDSGAGQPTVWVLPGATNREIPDQSQNFPFRYLARAIAFVASGGTVQLAAGTYSEREITISRPCSLVAASGVATIGR